MIKAAKEQAAYSDFPRCSKSSIRLTEKRPSVPSLDDSAKTPHDRLGVMFNAW
jgi:hypothetical protein